MTAPRGVETGRTPRPRPVDVAVVGAGFAGSLAALGLARAGQSVALLDRARHPRFAIGESSTPIASLVLGDYARRHQLDEVAPLAKFGSWRRHCPELRCGLKRGFSYFRHEDVDTMASPSAHANELLVAANPDAERGDTQWHRADVDHFLFRLARREGVCCRDGATLEIEPSDGGWRITTLGPTEPVTLQAAFLIDATGGADVTGQAGTATRVWHTRTRAVYAHVAGLGSWDEVLAACGAAVGEHPFASDDSAQHHLIAGGWIWMLRFADGLASVGLVEDLGSPCVVDRLVDPEQHWRQRLGSYPELRKLLAGAGLAGAGWRMAPRLQRMARRMCGENWALLPGAAGQVDPLHSTGIAHSLCGVERLVELLVEHRSVPRRRAEALVRYEGALRAELEWIDELVGACYRALPCFDLFTAATMLYFAAATTYERRRAHEGRRPWFLCADDVRLRAAVAGWTAGMPDARRQRVASREVAGLWAELRARLAPFNHVGLCDPEARNMYRYDVV